MKTLIRINFQHICPKNYFLIFIMTLLFSIDMKAQGNYLNSTIERKQPLIYSDAFVGFSKAGLCGVGQNLILGNQWGIHVGFINGHQTSNNQPTDYKVEKSGFHVTPTDRYNATSLRVARIFSVNKIIRFKAEVGISSLRYETVHFNPYIVTSTYGGLWDWLFGTSTGSTVQTKYYNVSYTKDKSLGLSTRLMTEFTFSRMLGMHAAILGTFTPKHSFIGLETGINLGRVRNK